jgi:hypothetical protein
MACALQLSASWQAAQSLVLKAWIQHPEMYELLRHNITTKDEWDALTDSACDIIYDVPMEKGGARVRASFIGVAAAKCGVSASSIKTKSTRKRKTGVQGKTSSKGKMPKLPGPVQAGAHPRCDTTEGVNKGKKHCSRRYDAFWIFPDLEKIQRHEWDGPTVMLKSNNDYGTKGEIIPFGEWKSLEENDGSGFNVMTAADRKYYLFDEPEALDVLIEAVEIVRDDEEDLLDYLDTSYLDSADNQSDLIGDTDDHTIVKIQALIRGHLARVVAAQAAAAQAIAQAAAQAAAMARCAKFCLSQKAELLTILWTSAGKYAAAPFKFNMETHNECCLARKHITEAFNKRHADVKPQKKTLIFNRWYKIERAARTGDWSTVIKMFRKKKSQNMIVRIKDEFLQGMTIVEIRDHIAIIALKDLDATRKSVILSTKPVGKPRLAEILAPLYRCEDTEDEF